MKVLSIVLIICATGFSERPVPVVNGRVTRFIEGLADSTIELLHSSQVVSNVNSKQKGSVTEEAIIQSYDNLDFASEAVAFGKTASEYRIEHKLPEGKLNGLFVKLSKHECMDSVNYDTTLGLISFSRKNPLTVLSLFRIPANCRKETKVLEGIAVNKINSFLPEFSHNLEFDHTNYTKSVKVSDTDVDSIISNVEVIFRRIFKGRIVPTEISYVALSLNPDGVVSSIRIKWPIFRRIPETNDQTSALFAKAGSVYEMLDKISQDVSDTTSHGSISRISVDGAANAWHLIEVDGYTILSPCISFQRQFCFSDSTRYSDFADVPLLKKYHK